MKIPNDLTIQFLVFLMFASMLSAATVGGIQLHWSVNGKGPRTVVMVHGWTCDETSWKWQVPELAKDFRVITLDLPGHGKSGSPKDGKLTMDLFARAIEAVRSEAKADRVALVGHSMGTPVIIHYARLYPQRVVALVFVDGAVKLPKNAEDSLRSSARRFAGPEGLKAREAYIRSMFTSLTTEETRRHILSMMLGASSATAMSAMEAVADTANWKDDVFAQPVLGVYTESSPYDRESLKSQFPQLEYVKMPGTGHFLMMEKPQEFNRRLKSFLDEQIY